MDANAWAWLGAPHRRLLVKRSVLIREICGQRKKEPRIGLSEALSSAVVRHSDAEVPNS